MHSGVVLPLALVDSTTCASSRMPVNTFGDWALGRRTRAVALDLTTGRSAAPVFHRVKAQPMPAMSNAQLYAALDAQDAQGHGKR